MLPELTHLQYAVLTILEEFGAAPGSPGMRGVDLREELIETTGEQRSTSAFYQVMGTLVGLGYVSSSQGRGASQRTETSYTLEPTGKTALAGSRSFYTEE